MTAPNRKGAKPAKKEAIDLHPIIDAVQDSLDRFQVLYEEGGDLTNAWIDLDANVRDLDDAIEKNAEAQ